MFLVREFPGGHYGQIFINENNQSFTEPTDSILTFNENESIVAAKAVDIDNDGLEDLVTVEGGSTAAKKLVLKKNNGDGFDNYLIHQLSNNFLREGIAFYDLDSDGDLDIVPNTSQIKVWFENKIQGDSILFDLKYLNAGNLINTRAPKKIGFKDLDGDGQNDLIIGKEFSWAGIYWSQNLGTGEFSEPVQITDNLQFYYNLYQKIWSIDVDKDLDNDIVSFTQFDRKIVYYENENGSFSSSKVLLNLEKQFTFAASPDVNYDGHEDLIYSQRNSISGPFHLHYQLRDPDSLSFDTAVVIALLELPNAGYGDMDGDGDMDFCGIYFGKFYWFENIDNHIFTPILIDETVKHAHSILVEDFDADGDKDICVSDTDRLTYYESDGSPSGFLMGQILPVPSNTSRVGIIRSGDLDNDGYLEICSSGWIGSFGDHWNGIYTLNPNTNSFDSLKLLPSTPSRDEIYAITDLNKDGLLDIVSGIGWFQQNNQGSFNYFYLDFDCFDLIATDVNNDDFDDIININGPLTWYENQFDSLAFIEGKIFKDQIANCEFDSLQDTIQLASWLVKLEDGDDEFYVNSNEEGHYTTFAKDSGDVVLSFLPPTPYWDGCFEDTTLYIAGPQTTHFIDNPAIAFIDCPLLQVSLANSNLRPCIEGFISVQYTNTGTSIAEDAHLEIILDSLLEATGSSIPWTTQNDSLLVFDLGNLDIGASGQIIIYVMPACDPEITGALICNSANIFPDSICLSPGSNWDGSTIEVSGFCQGDSIFFNIENSGWGDMAVPRIYQLEFIINDDIVMLIDVDTFQLEAGEITAVGVLAQGMFARMEAEQDPDHPATGDAYTFVVNCNNLNQNELFPFIIQFPYGTGNPTEATSCREITSSFDPNEKAGFPKGIGEEHLIEKDWELEYIIHFQNTGNDTAFAIIIRDTLSPYLDLAALRIGAASHPFSWNLTPENELIFTFENVLLPDSTTNEPNSHGFVQYFTKPLVSLPPGTLIENRAGIYFDINDPVITNTVFHKIKKPLVYGVEYIELCEGEVLNGTIITGDTLLRDSFIFSEYDSIHFKHVHVLEDIEVQVDTFIQMGNVFLGILIETDTILTEILTASNGCDSVINYQISILSNNIDLDKNKISLHVSPNPMSGHILIKASLPFSYEGNWLLTDVLGRNIRQVKVTSGIFQKTVDIADLMPGIYWYKFAVEGDRISFGKLVKK